MANNSPLDDIPGSKQDSIYWEEEKNPEDRGHAAYTAFKKIADEQASWREDQLVNLQMYRNMEMLGYGLRGGGYAKTRVPLSLNVVRNMVNAVHSRITRNRVKAMMQTKGAGWEAKERASRGEQFGTALALKNKLYKKAPMSFLDAATTGNGIIKTYGSKVKGEPVLERVFGPNLVVDFAEGADITVSPSHYYEVKYVSKRVLLRRAKEKKPELVEKIQELPTASAGDGDTYFQLQESSSTDRVQVVECLYLNPDDPEDGVLSIVAGGHEIDGGEWHTGDPYSIMRWAASPLGFYGMGLAEELRGIQSEINRLVRKVQGSFSLLANPYVFADRSSNIAKTQITDIPGTIVLYNGKEPRVVAPQTVNPEVFAHMDRLYQRAYEIAGISQLSAHGEKPAGIESGRAMLVYDDIQDSDRFANVHREYSEMQTDAIAKAIKATKAIPKYSVPIYGSKTYKEMTHKDLDLEGDDSWVIHPMPASLLGDTPTGQIQMADKLKEMGIIDDPADVLAEVASPDTQAFLRLQSSPKRIIQRVVGEMLSGGDYTPPEPQDNLALALDTAQLMYQEARLDGYPQDRLEKVRAYMRECKDQLERAAKTQAPTTGATMPNPAPQEQPPPLPPGIGPGAPQPAAPPPMMQ